tara:strand:+ start:116 stop:589 length:474 start_codon:yes stop_codon:yes gene_type:complete
MGKFHNLLDAKFNPPRNWTLDTPLKFDSDTLTDEGRDLLKYCGVRVTNKNVVSVPKGYITDLASVPRFCWAFIAPFDVARAAVIHDILYEKINTAYKGEKILTKHDREKYRKVADDVFKEGMESAVPPVPKWKIWAAYNAVRVFGRWAINSSAPRRV